MVAPNVAATANNMMAPSLNNRIQKLAVPMPKNIFQLLHPEQVLDFLLKAQRIAMQSGFEWSVLQQPGEGTMIVYKHPPEMANVPPRDGYGWMDVEIKAVVPVKGKDMEIYERKMGFKAEDKHVTIKRRRYRLLDPALQELCIIHYVTAVESGVMKLPIAPHMIKEMPILPERVAQPMPPRQQRHVEDIQRHTAKRNRSTRPGALEDYPGDEIDSSTTRLVAINRYKRNFEFIDQILSPFSTKDITPPVMFPGASKEKIEELKQKIDAMKSSMDGLKQKHDEQVTAFQSHNITIWNGIDGLKNSFKDVVEVQDDVETHLNVKYGASAPIVKKRAITTL